MKLSLPPRRMSRSELYDVRYCSRGASGAGGKKTYFGPLSFFCVVAQPASSIASPTHDKTRGKVAGAMLRLGNLPDEPFNCCNFMVKSYRACAGLALHF